MTPTTASPSSVLLNPVAQSAKPAAAADAEAAPGAALGGFELLLGAVQQLQQKLPTASGDSAAEIKKDVGGTGDGNSSGNALPQLGTILPSLAQPVPQASAQNAATDDSGANATETEAAPTVVAKITAKAEKGKDTDAKNTKEKNTAAAVDPALAVTLQPVAPGLVAQRDANSGAAASADAVALAAASTGANATVSAQSGVVSDGKSDRRADNSGAAVPTDAADTGDAAAVDSNTGAVAAAVKGLRDGLKPAAASDFDTLVKHFDATTPTQSPAVNTVGDSGSAHQASRTYFAAANSSASVSVPVGNSGWSDAVADKVMWFSANKISSAEIHLNPPDLGPLQVRVSLQHDQASVMFTSQHAAVRDALDQALPRLRDMMGSQGMHLLDVSVGGQSAQQSQQQFNRNSADRGTPHGGFFRDDPVEPTVTSVTAVNTARLLRSGVDAYA